MAKKMTEEEKRAFAEKMKAAREAKKGTVKPEIAQIAEMKKQETADTGMPGKTTEGEKTASHISSDEVAELRAMVRALQQQLASQSPQIVQVMADTEKVVMRWQAEVADDNVAVFGASGMYGQVTGKTGTVIVPKADWSRFYTTSVKGYIDSRWLIVLSGLDDDERERYGCKYRESEILDEKAFYKLLDMGRELLAVFPKLCRSHKEMVATAFLTAYEDGDARVKDRELIVALNELSKEEYKDEPKTDRRRRGLFVKIIEDMNAKDTEI